MERINVVFNSDGNIVHSEINGAIVMKSFLFGQPELRLGLNEDLAIGHGKSAPVVLDYVNFADFVNLNQYENSRILSLYPPDGEFTVMNYRVLSKYDMPFRIFPFVEKLSPYKIELKIKIRADIAKTNHGSNVLVRVPLPKSTVSATGDFGQGLLASTFEYKSSEHVALWGIKKLLGQTEQVIKIYFTLAEPAVPEIEKQVGPISLKFEVPMHNVSGLNVRFLKLKKRRKIVVSRFYNCF